jgi:putative transposase
MVRRPGTAGGPPAVPIDRQHRGWHQRRYLPHFDAAGTIQMITYRLADSLPAEVLREAVDAHRREPARRKRLEELLDAGYGSCLLRRPEIATLVIENWLRFDRVRYRLAAWVVMPNHAHVLVEIVDGHPVSRIVHSWKSFTAKAIAGVTGVQGRIWRPDYWDRVIRDAKHFAAAVDYIDYNPVKAGLARDPKNWPWSSAGTAREQPALPG